MKHKKWLPFGLCFSLFAVLFTPVSDIAQEGIRFEAEKVAQKNDILEADTKSLQDDAISITEIDPVFTSTLTNAAYTGICYSYTIRFSTLRSDLDFTGYLLGYYGEGDLYLPISIQYDVILSDGSSETRSTSFENTSATTNYNGLGGMTGIVDLDLNFDVFVDEGETIAEDSLVVYNVFPAIAETVITTGPNGEDRESIVFVPDTENPLYIDNIEANSSGELVDFTQYINAEFTSISSFSNYVSLSVNLDNQLLDFYLTKRGATYERYSEELESGEYELVYRFPTLGNSYVRFVYEDGTVIERVPNATNEYPISASSYFTEGNNNYTLIFPDIELEGIKSISLCSLDLQMRMIVTETDKDVVGTAVTTRLGGIGFESSDGISSVTYVDLNLVYILTAIIFALVYIGIEVGVYFYKKNKYKNDEFRRVDARSFFKTGSIGMVTLDLLLLDILAIIFRCGIFNNSIIVYNPFDIFIVVFSILLIILIGYFIKYFVGVTKDYIERRNKAKLKLDNDVEDDGTK